MCEVRTVGDKRFGSKKAEDFGLDVRKKIWNYFANCHIKKSFHFQSVNLGHTLENLLVSFAVAEISGPISISTIICSFNFSEESGLGG